jgi:hypothetical protein
VDPLNQLKHAPKIFQLPLNTLLFISTWYLSTMTIMIEEVRHEGMGIGIVDNWRVHVAKHVCISI